MIIQTSGSVATPSTGTANLYTDTNGFLNVKKPNGFVSRVAGHKLEFLADVVGPFTSGHVPVFDGTVFRSTSPTTNVFPAVNITSSGQVNVEVLLYSTTVGAGGVASVVWSGIPLDYDYLEFRGMMSSEQATGAHVLSCNFNNDTADGTRYRTTNFRGDEFVWYGQNVTDAGCGTIHALDKTDINVGQVNPVHFWMPFYGRTGNRKWLYGMPALWRHNNGIAIIGYICQWLHFTAAIGMLTFRVIPSSVADIAAGSVLQLYGHRRQWVVMSGNIGAAVNVSHGLLVP